MEVHIWLKHKRAEQETLARDVEQFLARGGEIERLDPGARSSDTRTAKQVHESNVHRKMAKNKAFAKKESPVVEEPAGEEEVD